MNRKTTPFRRIATVAVVCGFLLPVSASAQDPASDDMLSLRGGSSRAAAQAELARRRKAREAEQERIRRERAAAARAEAARREASNRQYELDKAIQSIQRLERELQFNSTLQ